MCQVWCSGIQGIYAQLGGQSAMGIYALCYIYQTYLVSWFCRDLCSIEGWGGINLPGVYVHCSIYMLQAQKSG